MGDNDSDGTFLASAAGKPAELASILAGRITAGQYPPGTRLPGERELAATFHVSRGTVRDAVAILAQRHVVRTKWGAGTIVLDTDEASLAIETVLRQADHERGNIRELRDLVEPPMAALAARRASPSDLVTLHGIIDHTDIRMTPRESLRMDMAFHLALAESTGNPLLAPDIPNLIVTPHCAWASRESRQRLVAQLAENIQSFLSGTPLRVVG